MHTEKANEKMATLSNHADEDYIDIEVMSSSSNNLMCYSISSPPQIREFEFQMCSVSKNNKEAATITTTSPADELFYRGKLLPLHLPHRLLMVQNLLQNSKTEDPFINNASSATITTNTSASLESSTVSPSVTSELNPDEYFFEWSNELSGFIGDHTKRSWARKLKQIKKSLLGQKLKDSRAYLKSLFSKSTACSDEICAKASCNLEAIANKSPFGKIEDVINSHRKSFSGAIQRHSLMKCSSSSTSTSLSSSFSFSSIGFYNLQLLKRSSSANSEIEIESSIEGAIAHCKQSQSQSQSHQLLSSRKNVNEAPAGVCSASKISVCGGQQRSEVCSI